MSDSFLSATEKRAADGSHRGGDDASSSSELRPATRAEIITKFTTVPVFNLVNNETQQCFPTVDNAAGRPMGTFYLDLADAEEQLGKITSLNPQLSLAIEAAPLSHAWALSEAWIDEAPPPGVLRLQASKAVLASLPGFPELPEELRGAFNPLTSQCPIWQMDELHANGEMPFFFHFEDMAAYWMAKTGQPRESLPMDGLDVTDLRVLVARMVSQADAWGRAMLVPPMRSMQVTTQQMPPLGAAADEVAAAIGRQAEPAALATMRAAVDGSEPPPLEGDEPPPLE